ncbi:MAG: peptidoglycan DD-metalloendopeptidase family protein [Burkholderiales bacterium]
MIPCALRNMPYRWGLALLLVPALGLAQGDSGAEDLEALRSRIERLRVDITGAEETRDEARDQLRESERAISVANRALRNLAAKRAAVQNELKKLAGQRRATESGIASRQESLGQLLTLRYLNGEQNHLKLLLSGEDPNRTARELHYYGYISRAQTEFIRALQASLARLRELEARTREKGAELAAIESEQRKERNDLFRQQAARRKVLARVSVQLREQRRQVKRLERDESRLSRLVEELGKVIASTPPGRGRRNEKVPESGGREGRFAGLKGSLRLPIRGELASRFGTPRSGGGPPWKGLFIRSPSGQEVRAVAAGRVVFADWLRGFGNLLILDHGQGYLTIYGNNESVLKQVGEPVRTGDAVATVGASGGNAESGLYFEIRYQGKAFDPMRWVSLK